MPSTRHLNYLETRKCPVYVGWVRVALFLITVQAMSDISYEIYSLY